MLRLAAIAAGLLLVSLAGCGAAERTLAPPDYRVTNGSKTVLDEATSDLEVTYGPNRTEAQNVYLVSRPNQDFPDEIPPGEAETGFDTFAIPAKYHDDVQVLVEFDPHHDPAVFSGSIR